MLTGRETCAAFVVSVLSIEPMDMEHVTAVSHAGKSAVSVLSIEPMDMELRACRSGH